MDEARAMLDQLMGKARNLSDNQKDSLHQIHFYDDQVCKYYICGLCPYVAFFGTKSDMGKCPFPICGDIDADTCRAEWNRLTQAEKDKYGYEWKLLHCLENIVKQCDKKIEKQKLRAEQDMELTEDDMRRIASLYRQIGTLIEQCEYYSDRGDIDRSMDIMKEIETLKESARKIANPPEEKKITVCEISGNFMSSRDNDERMRAHFEGKQFVGWKMVRDKYAQLLKQNPPEPNSRREKVVPKESEKDRDGEKERTRRGRSVEKRSRSPDQRGNKRGPPEPSKGENPSTRNDRDRDRDLVKDRNDRDRDSGRDRDRDRARDRDRDRSRDRNRDRDDRRKRRSTSRDRDSKRPYDDRNRDYKSDRDRERERDRNRERERDHRRDRDDDRGRGKHEKDYPTNLDAFIQPKDEKVLESGFKDRKQFISGESERLAQLEKSLQTKTQPQDEEDGTYFDSLLGKRNKDSYDDRREGAKKRDRNEFYEKDSRPRRKRGDVEEGEESE